MHFGKLPTSALALLMISLVAGCHRSETVKPVAKIEVSPDAVVRLHWLGKRRLDIMAGAYYISRIWMFPQTARLQSQTLDKLSTAPWRLLFDPATASQIPPVILRPLLEDCLQEESYLEVRDPAGRPGELAFAVHLPASRAGLWETNLAVAAGLLTGQYAEPDTLNRGWTLYRSNAPALIALARVGDWTVVAIGPTNNALFLELTSRITRYSAPLPVTPTNAWVDADVDLVRACEAMGVRWHPPASFPRCVFNVSGDGGSVFARGTLTFPQKLPLELEPWAIPTNLVHEPLISFTAVRGFKSTLAAVPVLTNLFSTVLPDQICAWSLEEGPFQTYAATPLADARHQISLASDWLMAGANLWLTNHGLVGFDRSPDGNGVTWGNQPGLRPFLKAANGGSGDILYAGLLPDSGVPAGVPAPTGLFRDVLRRTNLVYYDWEITGKCVDAWLHRTQLARQLTRTSQLPLDSAGMAWLSQLVTRLGSSTTVVTRTATNQLAFVRRSTIGLTGNELHLLADWLESPTFPVGLHSTNVLPEAVR